MNRNGDKFHRATTVVAAFVFACAFGAATAAVALPDPGHNVTPSAALDSAHNVGPSTTRESAQHDAAPDRSVDPPLDRFESDIQAFEAQDRLNPPTPGGTLFIGSSTFALARQKIEARFKDFHAIDRAFGGSTIPEINHYFDRVVAPYKPVEICFYAGTNDIADGHSGRRVYEDFVEFVQKVQTRLPQADIYFVSMSVAPSRLHLAHEYDVGNALVRGFAAGNPHVHYIDVTSVMHDKHGQLHSEWFRKDRLHMTERGYAAWIPILRQSLREGHHFDKN